MFMKSPEFHPAGGMTRHPTTVSDYSEANRKERFHETSLGQEWHTFGRTRRVLAKSAIYGSMATLPFGVYLKYDVLPEYERLANTHPEVIDVYQAANPSDAMTDIYGIMGLGNISAEETMTTLHAYADVGDVHAIKLDNQGIDIHVISDVIMQDLEEEEAHDAPRHSEEASNLLSARTSDDDIQKIGFVGGSMGGDIVPRVAIDLQDRYDMEIRFVVLDCSPLNLESVRPEHRDKGLQLMKYMPAAHILGADVARSVRFPVEMIARKERYMNGVIPLPGMINESALRAAAVEVYMDKILKDVANGRFINVQFGQINSDEARESLVSLSEPSEDGQLPAIIYMRPDDPSRDTVVDVSLSQKLVTSTTSVENANLLIVKMSDTGHANPNQSPGPYNAAIYDKIIPFLERQESRTRTETLAYLAIEQAGPHLAILEPR
ncbi:hypothetical protein EON76_02745 [bacterium]|nr:MAG: hypothetical protein EON76_02745 [bacterium]